MKSMRLLLLMICIVFSLNAEAQRKKEKNKITPETGSEKETTALDQKQAQYKATKEHHLEIQDKATRKRMKKTKKKAQKYSWGKDVPWYKRWFIRDKF